MKVKIGNKIYDSNDEPIMIIIDLEEQSLIRDMSGSKFASFPELCTTEQIEDFMKE